MIEASVERARNQIADIVGKRLGSVYTSRATLLDVADHLLDLVAIREREARRQGMEAAAQIVADVPNGMVYGLGVEDFTRAMIEEALDGVKADAMALIRARAQAEEGRP